MNWEGWCRIIGRCILPIPPGFAPMVFNGTGFAIPIPPGFAIFNCSVALYTKIPNISITVHYLILSCPGYFRSYLMKQQQRKLRAQNCRNRNRAKNFQNQCNSLRSRKTLTELRPENRRLLKVKVELSKSKICIVMKKAFISQQRSSLPENNAKTIMPLQ